MPEKDIWDKINILTAILLLIVTILLVLANFKLVDENKQLLNISDIQRQISESQRNIMQSNLDLIKPNLKCWWNSTDFYNTSVTNVTVINFGQLPGEVKSVYVRQPAIFVIGPTNKDIINYTLGETPAHVIRGGESETFSIPSNLTKINLVKIFTTDNEIMCDKINESVTTYISSE